MMQIQQQATRRAHVPTRTHQDSCSLMSPPITIDVSLSLHSCMVGKNEIMRKKPASALRNNEALPPRRQV